MQFSSEAIKNKMHFLDAIDSRPELVEKILSKHLPRPYTLEKLSRYWEPGGGSTCFKVSSEKHSYFLKVKHSSVFVESRLESESEFMQIPSLRNEHNFLKKLPPDMVPQVLFYDECESFCFLALEWLDTFRIAVEHLAANELLAAWNNLESFIHSLYLKGIVHTDIHEGNICFRGKSPVLCDFEEARYFPQRVTFHESLDCRGANKYGNVGDFPVSTGMGIAGLTCLERLRKVFVREIKSKMPKFLESCNFDYNCPFNLDEFQEDDRRVYQSISVGDIRVIGQRPIHDARQDAVRYLIRKLARSIGFIHYLDIGCNMGMFCFNVDRLPCVEMSTGLEAFSEYIAAADLLRFVADARNVRFHKFICGKDKLDELLERVDFCTVLSVYHHIPNKEYFLAELATQDRYYKERGDVWHEIEFIKDRLGFPFAHRIMNTRDYQRPLILFAYEPLTPYDRIALYLINKVPAVILRALRWP
jgi:hypothetical protein